MKTCTHFGTTFNTISFNNFFYGIYFFETEIAISRVHNAPNYSQSYWTTTKRFGFQNQIFLTHLHNQFPPTKAMTFRRIFFNVRFHIKVILNQQRHFTHNKQIWLTFLFSVLWLFCLLLYSLPPIQPTFRGSSSGTKTMSWMFYWPKFFKYRKSIKSDQTFLQCILNAILYLLFSLFFILAEILF